MNRTWKFLPLVPCFAAVAAWLSPPSAATLAYYPAMVSYNTLRASVFVGSFYASVSIAIALLYLRPSKTTAIVGLATSSTFINTVYLWTAAHVTTFQWLVWAAWSPTNGIGFYALDWLTVGMVCLAALIAFMAWVRKGALRAALRALEMAALAILPLPAYILVFDYSEFYIHVANVGPAWLTNQDLLVGSAAVFAGTALVDYYVHHERSRRTIQSALAVKADTTS